MGHAAGVLDFALSTFSKRVVIGQVDLTTKLRGYLISSYNRMKCSWLVQFGLLKISGLI
jgi:hypothetical protein